MNHYFASIFIGLFLTHFCYATHNRAGEITYRQLSSLTYEVTVTTYTKTSSAQADRDSIEVNWGDGTINYADRINTEFYPNDIQRNTYIRAHSYLGPSTYIISVTDPNRILNIININNGNSDQIQFYLENLLIILDPQFFGLNNTPTLLQPPIDYANVNDIYIHNPNAYDIDGDSISFELIPPKSGVGQNVPGYKYPNEVDPGPGDDFVIDARTGELVWNVPKIAGIYNIAILVKEYRNGFLIGSLIRDMQIIVLDENNDPPIITEINDTCIIAGSLLFKEVFAFDPNPGQVVTLTADGGPMQVQTNPATFIGGSSSGPISGQFSWQTDCNHIRKQFYEVVFKAEDNFSKNGDPRHLTDLETWLINVIGPAPQNLVATPFTGSIQLTWNNPYLCANTSNFKGFSVYKSLGSANITIDTCNPELDGNGYSKIAVGLTNYSYTDNDVAVGFEYCYRVAAEFGDGVGEFSFNKVSSLPSNETCSQLKKDIPILTHVNVLQTDITNGKILVKWIKPLANDLDTAQNPGPYEYRLYRNPGFSGLGSLIATITSVTFNGLSDTSFIDSLLNTVIGPYTYNIEFYVNGGTLLGSPKEASSIFTTTSPTDNKIILNWQENVPWFNEQYIIYRQNPISMLFDSIATTTIQSYTDKNLTNGTQYCYLVQSSGTYGTVGFDTLINNSQIICKTPVDNIPPCDPIVSIINNCDLIPTIPWQDANFKNELSWVDPNDSCKEDVLFYRIYYKPTSEADSQLIFSTTSKFDSTYTHTNLFNSVAGCYIIAAVDSNNNESAKTNKVCVDNCPIYELPNVFTPNGDNANDLFTPIKKNSKFTYRFIDHVEFKVFNRWGQLLFETTDPQLNWDGTDQNSKKLITEGVYYYGCEIYERKLEGVIKRKEPLKGYIHLIRGTGK